MRISDWSSDVCSSDLLFDSLIEAIEQDDASRHAARTTIILLGDLIDRGPDSAAVVARAKEWAKRRQIEFIKGNHEEMLISSMSDVEVLRGFLKYGGRETVLSYGIDPVALRDADFDELQQMMIAAIPQDDIDFLDGFQKFVQVGD